MDTQLIINYWLYQLFIGSMTLVGSFIIGMVVKKIFMLIIDLFNGVDEDKYEIKKVI